MVGGSAVVVVVDVDVVGIVVDVVGDVEVVDLVVVDVEVVDFVVVDVVVVGVVVVDVVVVVDRGGAGDGLGGGFLPFVSGGDGGGGGELLIAVLVTATVDGGGGGGGSTTGGVGGGGEGGRGARRVPGVSRLGAERGVSPREPEAPALEEPSSVSAPSRPGDAEPVCELASGAEYSSPSASAWSSSSVPTRAGVPRLPDPFPAGCEARRRSRLADFSSTAGVARRSSRAV